MTTSFQAPSVQTPIRHGRPITIFGFDYPADVVNRHNLEDRDPPVQTQLFARRLTRAIRLAFADPILCVSAAPISEFPRNRRLIVGLAPRQRLSLTEGEVDLLSIPFVNRGVMKILTRAVSSAAIAILLARTRRGGLVFVYSAHVPFMLSGLLLARLARSKAVAVWTDPPAVTIARDGRLLGPRLRNIESSIASLLMKRFDLVIAVTRQLAEDWAPEAPHMVMEALTDETGNSALPQYRSGGTTIVSYTGALDRRYGVDQLAAAALNVSPKYDIRVRFFGEGDYADDLRKLAEANPRIEFGGRVDLSSSLHAQRASDFLINARDPSDSYTKYSFPSKTLEYLASGVPTISTALPGIPAEYLELLIILKNNEADHIAKTLEQACELTADERRARGERGAAFAKTKSFSAQAPRIAHFVREHG